MVQLEEATRRLESAVDRLDRAVHARSEQSGEAQAGDGLEELRGKLERRSEENARLQQVAAEAGDRIDSALGRLKALLGD